MLEGCFMEQRVMGKKDVKTFISKLMELYPVYGPAAKGKHDVFKKYDDASQAKFGYTRSILPPKKYLMPQHELLVKYSLGENPSVETVVESEDQVIIGVHPCDIRAISLLDLVMLNGNKDANYSKKREHTIIIGIDCVPDQYCYCSSVIDLKPTEGFDLFLTDLGDEVLVDVGSAKGKELLDKCISTTAASKDHASRQEKLLVDKAGQFKAKINAPASMIPLSLEGQWEAPVWKEMGEKCLSCGQCVLVCPTCYCFDVQDDPDIKLTKVERSRKWDGCQLAEFASVGSGENFREEASGRIRHRYNRKFKYHVDSLSKTFCTGCGRCWEYCPVEINLVEISNRILNKEAACK